MTVRVLIKNRWSGAVQFNFDLPAEVSGASRAVQLGCAVKAAHASYVRLSGADCRGADMSGADFRGANLRDTDFRGANLRDTDFRGADFRYARLSDTDFRGADLRFADLRFADFRGADFRGADFRGADMSGAVFRGSDLRDIDDCIPRIENIHIAIFAAASKPLALDMGVWHSDCGTAHCRAGWAVVLAGDGGRVLEDLYGTSVAAALIYAASDPELERVPDFSCDNATALADMQRLALADMQRLATGQGARWGRWLRRLFHL